MLSDRDYMGQFRRRTGATGGNAITCVFILITLNILVFILQGMGAVRMVDFGLTYQGLTNMKLWQPITYMFLHGDFWHIVFNMWGLYMFGTVVGREMDTNRFLTLYFISGISGGLLFLLFNWGKFYGVLIGASAAVSGVTLAAAMMFPEMRIMLLIPPIPMKMKTFALVFIAIEVFFQAGGIQGGVAHLAHLGGVLGGYIFLKTWKGDQLWDPFDFILGYIFPKNKKRPSVFSSSPKKKPPAGWTVHSSNSSFESHVPQYELDRILDKISSQGINSLTSEEMQTLRKAREDMKKNG